MCSGSGCERGTPDGEVTALAVEALRGRDQRD